MTKKKARRPITKKVTEEKEVNICAICCKTFSTRKGEATMSNFTYHFHLQKLCASIIDSNGRSKEEEETGDPTRTTGNRRKSVSVPSKNSFTPLLCQSCLSQMSSVCNKRVKLIGMEGDVRKLQLQILKLLNSLHEGVESFKKEMEKLERTIRDSSGKESQLDDFFSREGDEGGGDHGDVSGKSKIKDVIQFREKIFSAVEGLREFNGILQRLPEVKSASLSQTPKVKSCGDGNSNVLNTSIHPPTTPKSPPSLSLEMEAEEGEGGASGDEWMPNEDVSSDDDKEPPSVNVTPSRLRNGRNTREAIDCSEMEDDASRNDDDEDEYIPKSLANKKKKPRKDPLRDAVKSKLASIDFTGMTDFKKSLITCSIQKSESYRLGRPKSKHSTSTTADSATNQFDEFDPLKTHFMAYDPTTDTLNLADFQLTINSVEESVKCLDCSLRFLKRTASGKQKSTTDLNIQLLDHILGVHLKLYTCPHCPSVSLTTHKRFRAHVLGHLNHFQCDICGKPLKGPEILRRHKWLHMNEEEKSEALKAQGIEDGLTPIERNTEKRRALDKNRFQCSTCGKGFPLQCYLQRHEETHLQEKRHMCSDCGKSFKSRSNLLAHQRYGCNPDEAGQHVTRFPCDQCPKNFKHRRILRQHKALVHENQNLLCVFKCPICDKEFRTKASLRGHELTHSDARPCSCRKGCGATFKTTSHSKRHEKKCGKNRVNI